MPYITLHNPSTTMKNEIILYRTDELTEHIEVRIEEDTVWLTQQQMASLFNQTKQNISLHINNCFKEKELTKKSTVKDSLTVQKEGNRNIKRKIEYYNLDVIISVGYRIKSKQGTQFRIWANRILKDYLLKGYELNNRINRIENQIEDLKSHIDEIDLQINSHLMAPSRASSSMARYSMPTNSPPASSALPAKALYSLIITSMKLP